MNRFILDFQEVKYVSFGFKTAGHYDNFRNHGLYFCKSSKGFGKPAKVFE